MCVCVRVIRCVQSRARSYSYYVIDVDIANLALVAATDVVVQPRIVMPAAIGIARVCGWCVWCMLAKRACAATVLVVSGVHSSSASVHEDASCHGRMTRVACIYTEPHEYSAIMHDQSQLHSGSRQDQARS